MKIIRGKIKGAQNLRTALKAWENQPASQFPDPLFIDTEGSVC